MGVSSHLKFYCTQLRRFRPALFAALLASLSLLIVSTGSYLVNRDKLATGQQASEPQIVQPTTLAGSLAPAKPPGLPRFDSAVLVSQIEQASVSTGVSTDEVTFALEEGAGQPYRRYRATFTMLGDYPRIRAAVANILENVSFSSLDSLKCTRDDIDVAEVSCTVSMSAFYQRSHSQ